MIKILLTGGTGFIGRRLIVEILAATDWEIYSLERARRLTELYDKRLHRVYHDFCSPLSSRLLARLKDTQYIVHAGAEVSGARSLATPEATVRASVLGTHHLLEASRALSPKRFIYVSTGEVLGAAPPGIFFAEDAPLRPSNPYSAAKAAAEALVRSYHVSFGVPAVTVRSMNLFGPGQDLRRFVPMALKSILTGEIIYCHVGRDNLAGSRNWLSVDPFVRELLVLIETGVPGEIYHVVGPERDNDQIIWALGRALNRRCNIARTVPGTSHDLRYALKDTKLGLSFEDNFEASLAATARWYEQTQEESRWTFRQTSPTFTGCSPLEYIFWQP